MGKLEGKVACITGGTRSIGRAMAEVFVSQGAKVVVKGRNEEKGHKCLEEIGAGDAVSFFAGDSSKQSVVEGLIDFTVSTYGQLDISRSPRVKPTSKVAAGNATEQNIK